ncbi:hypothetical protein CDS [Bradyrhizobium sp.]|nr:hypothetical protein CDS [Bradyrhizobium sp.]
MEFPAQLPDQFAQVVDVLLNDVTAFRLARGLGASGFFALIFVGLLHAQRWPALRQSF